MITGDGSLGGETFDRFIAHPVSSIGGSTSVPGDKSISHRALLLGAIGNGVSTVDGLLVSEDCLATLAALRAMGVRIEEHSRGRFVIHGAGTQGLRAASRALDVGNSGTAIRLLAGLLAGQAFDSELTGDASLCRRPMERVAEPLRAMGAEVTTTKGCPPLHIRGNPSLTGIDYTLPVASAQVKSALLLAGLSARGRTTVRSPAPTRDHTERMLVAMGVALEQSADARVVSLNGPASLEAIDLTVPGDFSSAAFFIVAGCLRASEGLLIRGVGVNPTRTGLLDALRAMGARIETREVRQSGSEPVADIYVRQSALRGIDVAPALVPLMIDEFPILFVAAACARGRTLVRGAEELRHKESDRIKTMANALGAVGIDARELADGLVVEGGDIRGGVADSCGDHRVAMALAVAGLAAREPIQILNTAQVGTSFPGFVASANQGGLRVDGMGSA